jgi:MerR family mercuric resistance operon transcriptional regulator
MMDPMTIGHLTAAAGVNVETVRYYQRRELLAMPDHQAAASAATPWRH